MTFMTTARVDGVTIKAEDTLNCLSRLPAFNETAVKLLGRPFGEEDSIGDLEASFRTDPGLASQLLVAANSAAFGFRSQISTIRHALAVLGLDRIRALVLTIATCSYMRQFPVEIVRPIWSHGIATAVIAEHLAKYSDGLAGAALYTAGLTHDLGRLGLLASARHKYEMFLFDEYEDRDESELREWELFGVIHTVAGGLLTQPWGFPESLCSHAENHHAETGFDTEADRIVHNACILAGAMGYPELRLRSAEAPDATLQWQGKRVDDSCRESVERRIQEFLS
jgi:HD-like signal output (HDOD) protein